MSEFHLHKLNEAYIYIYIGANTMTHYILLHN